MPVIERLQCCNVDERRPSSAPQHQPYHQHQQQQQQQQQQQHRRHFDAGDRRHQCTGPMSTITRPRDTARSLSLSLSLFIKRDYVRSEDKDEHDDEVHRLISNWLIQKEEITGVFSVVECLVGLIKSFSLHRFFLSFFSSRVPFFFFYHYGK